MSGRVEISDKSLGGEFSHELYTKTDVFIAGGGPIGATLAKQFIDAEYEVVMAEQGSSESFKLIKDKNDTEVFVPGSHKKNDIEYQKDIDRFVNVIKGALSAASVPVSDFNANTLNPIAWGAGGTQAPVSNGKNPNQRANTNLPAEAVARGVGGMSTHWTCATPRFHPTVELPVLVGSSPSSPENTAEWDKLYTQAESLIGTTRHAFDKSIRHTLVLRTLQDAYGSSELGLPHWPECDVEQSSFIGSKASSQSVSKGRRFGPLPLACHRMPNPDYVSWHAADTVLRHIYEDPEKRARFTLLTNTGCRYLELRDDLQGEREGKKVRVARCTNYLAGADGENPTQFVEAKFFVVAAGAVATPQILFNTELHNNKDRSKPFFPNLGKYITEQPMSFCQVVMKKELMESIPKNPYNLPWWKAKVDQHQKTHPEDPLKFPFYDPEPQVTSPLSVAKPWHTQIHRDAFSYGAVASTIDSRTVVDLRFFGYVNPNESNTLTFETKYFDAYGMPQPTFHFQLAEEDAERAHGMMTDMCEVASKLGGYLPGSEPQFMEPGLALHLGGTTRAGPDPKTHVADTSCKVFNFDNLYVAGNGVIPTGFAANPTLTSMCYALRAAEDIIAKLGGSRGESRD